jgi:diguanylate cyclase (GGDEF)-like protein
MNIDTNKMALSVLLVEDSRAISGLMCKYLERMGIPQPFIAETGMAAIEAYQKEHPDIILMDVQLPDINGFEVARRIREMESSDEWTAIIFLTGMSNDADLEVGIQAGGDDYLMKPVSEVVLHAKVRAMQRLVEMQRQLVQVKNELNAANRELQRLSSTDGLTGIPNRRAFDSIVQREWRRCERLKKPIALVMLDVDHFKLFNDKYGHQAGDECLKCVAAQAMAVRRRPTDVAARYGGEEFVLVLGETDADGAQLVASRLCQMVVELKIPHYASSSQNLTVSCGVACVVPERDLSLEVLLKSADHALYRAKAAGRSRVEVCDYGEI